MTTLRRIIPTVGDFMCHSQNVTAGERKRTEARLDLRTYDALAEHDALI